jgi:uncharacterized repeat protein (TIGR03803 family)
MSQGYRTRLELRVEHGVFAFLAVALLLVPAAWAVGKYKVLHAFTGKPDGGGVYAGVVIDAKGNLYGKTSGGGAYGYGTVFELTPGSGGKWTETILHNFCSLPHCDDGAASFSGLILGATGDLFGTSNTATFEMTPGSGGWTFSILCDCIVPSVFDAAGNLYGIGGPGEHNAGAVVELMSPSTGNGSSSEKVLYSFCSQPPQCRDGEPPEWGLAWDAMGNLYGTTELGGNGYPACPGSGGCGVAYQLSPGKDGQWKHHTLHRFAAFRSDGELPLSGVVIDGSGNVYGTTVEGGRTRNNNVCPVGCGTVYKLTPESNGQWKETILHDFPNSARDGNGPVGGLVFDNAGNLYGTTSGGGDPVCQCGVIFKMIPSSNGKWSYTVLHRFTGKDGWSPQASLILDKNYKHLYGTTVEGGPGGAGVVFEITQ